MWKSGKLHAENMLKIAICDDEQNAREYLSTLVREQGFECVVKTYSSAGEYLSKKEPCDILLLDIDMGAGNAPDGMELAERIRGAKGRQPVIIFVTGYEDYVYNAFDVKAFQYLLKPIQEKRFSDVLERAVKEIRAGREREGRALEIRFSGMKRIVPYAEIVYIESQNHTVLLHTREQTFRYYARIGALEEELTDGFFRIHKSYLLNLSFVESYNKTAVTLSNGEALFISKHRFSSFVKAYLHYMKHCLA